VVVAITRLMSLGSSEWPITSKLKCDSVGSSLRRLLAVLVALLLVLEEPPPKVVRNGSTVEVTKRLASKAASRGDTRREGPDAALWSCHKLLSKLQSAACIFTDAVEGSLEWGMNKRPCNQGERIKPLRAAVAAEAQCGVKCATKTSREIPGPTCRRAQRSDSHKQKKGKQEKD